MHTPTGRWVYAQATHGNMCKEHTDASYRSGIQTALVLAVSRQATRKKPRKRSIWLFLCCRATTGDLAHCHLSRRRRIRTNLWSLTRKAPMWTWGTAMTRRPGSYGHLAPRRSQEPAARASSLRSHSSWEPTSYLQQVPSTGPENLGRRDRQDMNPALARPRRARTRIASRHR